MFMLIAAAVVALVAALTVLLVPVAGSLAVRFGWIARPAEARFHDRPVPLGGGVAMLLAIVMPCLLALALASVWAAEGGPPAWLPGAVEVHVTGAAGRAEMALWILAGAAALCGVGLIDDRRGLRPTIKLAVQVAIAGAVVAAAPLKVLTAAGEPWSTLLSVGWIVVIVNAMNFMDNMDGLAAGVTLLCACALLAAAASVGQLFVAGWLCLLIGATAGFLVFNFPPARIFMGDAGSMMLGYFLAVGSMLTTYYDPALVGSRMYGVLAPMAALAVPLYDLLSVLSIRLRERRPLMVGDTRHFSHRLVARGMSVRAAVLTVYLCTAVTGIAAALLGHVGEWAAWMLAGQTLGVLGIIALLESANGQR